MPARILIVEDDESLQPLLAYLVESEGYAPELADSGHAMHQRIKVRMPDLVVLDLNLPDESGLALARQLRARSQVPIIVLTASQDKGDLLAALELGVDDFLTKPFEPRELVLRIRNVLARHTPKTGESRDAVAFDGWTLNLAGRALFDATGNEVALTPGEFDILAALLQAPGRVLSRDILLDAICRGGDSPLPRMVDVHISQLRKKVEVDSRTPALIVTVKGAGYKFVGKVE
jgi:two-component system, OmpR family, torCAD operon response regulator TorR